MLGTDFRQAQESKEIVCCAVSRLQAVLRHGLLFLVLQAVLCANAHGAH